MKSLYTSHSIGSLLIALVIVAPSNLATAQNNYKPLLDTTAVWNFEHTTECEPYTPYYGFRYSLILDGDTSIGNTVYQKLYRSAWEFFTPEWFSGTLEDCDSWAFPATGYVGSLRENVIERKVYYLAAEAEEELLLYDFSLEVGDSLDFYFPDYVFWENANTAIDIKDSVLINGEYHQRWIIEEINGTEGTGDVVFIEGIGGLHGLVEPDAFFMLHHPITELICYNNANGDLYPLDFGSCAIITEVHEIEAFDQIEVFPNPTSEHFSVILPAEWALASTVVEITDITGRLIWENNEPVSSTITINTSGWTAGIYLLQVRTSTRRQSTRLVVQ